MKLYQNDLIYSRRYVKKTLLKFFLFLTVVIACFAVVIITVRHFGLQTEHETPNHLFKRASIEIIAHRGGALEAPENTLTAFDRALEISPHFILEMDIHLTKDEHLAVIHDDTVNRTTNGKGAVSEMTMEQLQKLDAGWHYQNDKGEYTYRSQGVQIPSLRQVLEKYPHQKMIVELKSLSTKAAQKFIDVIEEFKAFEHVAIASYSHQAIDYIRSKRDWVFIATPTEIYKSLILLNMFLEPIDPMEPDIYDIPEVSMFIPVLSKRLLKEMHRRNKPVFVWTINEQENMKRLIELGVDGIITDRPTTLFQLIGNN